MREPALAYVGKVFLDGRPYGDIFIYQEQWLSKSSKFPFRARQAKESVDWRILQEPEEFTTWGHLGRRDLDNLQNAHTLHDGDVVHKLQDCSDDNERLRVLSKFTSRSERRNFSLIPTLSDFCHQVLVEGTGLGPPGS